MFIIYLILWATQFWLEPVADVLKYQEESYFLQRFWVDQDRKNIYRESYGHFYPLEFLD